MCCLFGIYAYKGGLTAAQKRRLVSALATASEDRGTDATGISYNSDGHLAVYKRPWPAHLIRFRLPEGVRCIMGHTRMTTQGDEKQNCNNHPFVGTAGIPFALAHNGILYNDKELRQERKLPETNIETDSYIAVQLLEQQGKLNFSTIRTVAEALEGTLTLTILDGRDNLYIVKGNNPLTLYHFPRLGLFAYPSVDSISSSCSRERPSLRTSVNLGIVRIQINKKGCSRTFWLHSKVLKSLSVMVASEPRNSCK